MFMSNVLRTRTFDFCSGILAHRKTGSDLTFTAINWVTVSLPDLFLFSLLIIFLYVPTLKHVFLKQTRIPSALWIINYFYSVSFLRLNAFNWDLFTSLRADRSQ